MSMLAGLEAEVDPTVRLADQIPKNQVGNEILLPLVLWSDNEEDTNHPGEIDSEDDSIDLGLWLAEQERINQGDDEFPPPVIPWRVEEDLTEGEGDSEDESEDGMDDVEGAEDGEEGEAEEVCTDF